MHTTTTAVISRDIKQVSKGVLERAMLSGEQLELRLDRGLRIKGYVNQIEHEDGSGYKFNVKLRTETGDVIKYIQTTDRPRVFGINSKHAGVELRYTEEAFSRAEIFRSFFNGEPTLGAVSIDGHKAIIAGVVRSIEREDGSGHSFILKVNNTNCYARTRD